MNKKMFVIGIVHINITDDNHCLAKVTTQERLTEHSKEGISFNKDGQNIELVPPGGTDRNVPGLRLSNRFMEFFNNKILALAG